MLGIDLHKATDDLTQLIAISSMVHNILPPWDLLNGYPRIQKVYKVLVYSVGYMALNARSTIQRSISINNPRGHNSPSGD
jgi:hypothetical protein